MKTGLNAATGARYAARVLVMSLGVIGLTAGSARGQAPEKAPGQFASRASSSAVWPPAPPLEAPRAAEGAATLPDSIAAEPTERDEWRCRFRFRPAGAAKSVVVVGSFNGWDRQANPLRGPSAAGEWVGEVTVGTGVWEYKFLINGDEWFADPANVDRVPDGFGGFNSVLRLGRLAQMRKSEAQVGDGKIELVGLAHRPPGPMYVQPQRDEVSIRYRTLAHDVKRVALAVRGAEIRDMRPVAEGPLFTYWEARAAAPEAVKGRGNVRSLEYTFVLEDGGPPVADPYTYNYTLTPGEQFETPEWARHAVWYQVFLDRFRNGDPANDPPNVRPWTSEWFTASPWEGRDGQTFYNNYVFDRFYGGDLEGLEQQLPYLKALGVNALYLNPIFKAPSNHKYDVQNYLHVDDGFGTRGDYDAVAAKEDLLNPATWQWTPTDRRFLAFVQRAHEAGFKVILDGVFNHTGLLHPAFLDVQKNGRKSPMADWFDVTSWEPFDYNGWAGFEHMPVFRKSREGFESSTLKQHLFNITRRWMDPDGDGNPADGIDGWRLDVPSDIPRPFWEEWRAYVKKINPDALITGEIWARADQWLDGRHFDAVMNYEFAKVAVGWVFDRERKITASEADGRLAELRLAYPAAATYACQTLVSSHDTDRLASMALNPDREYDRQNRVQDNNPDYNNGRPTPAAYARARLVALLQMTYVGSPMVYYGDEVGMWGADDPTNRKPMLWKDLEPYEKPEENCVLDEQLAFYKQVIALRNEHRALRDGSFQTLLTDDAADVWAFVRTNGGEHVLVVLNASDAPRSVQVPLAGGLPATWQVIFNSGGAGGRGPADAEDTGISLVCSHDKLGMMVPAVGGVVLSAPHGE